MGRNGLQQRPGQCRHVRRRSQPDFTWSLIDKGSTHSTTVNGAEDPTAPYVPVR
ncbi:hypothetical protein [Streptomyces sp. NPDC051642]|uniref:hypothetical protein n=1 Tax=unclassified Streptomyces TaxID=2593676 RepID=UPI00344AE516